MGVRIASHADFSITPCQKYRPFVIADSSSYDSCYVPCQEAFKPYSHWPLENFWCIAFEDLDLSLVHS